MPIEMKIDYQDLFYKLVIEHENLKIEHKLLKEELAIKRDLLSKI
jgi:hypothetical protein